VEGLTGPAKPIRTQTSHVGGMIRIVMFAKVMVMPRLIRSVVRRLLLPALFCVPIAAATAQTVVLPAEAQLGPRPFYLVDKMKDGPLKTKLGACTGPFRKSNF
jgi:hypothetical protein